MAAAPAVESDHVVMEPIGVSPEPVCPKSGPPSNWFASYKKFAKECNACRALELGLPRKGKVHSAACCAHYVRWLEEPRMLVSKDSVVGGEEPPKEWFDDLGMFTSECSAW